MKRCAWARTRALRQEQKKRQIYEEKPLRNETNLCKKNRLWVVSECVPVLPCANGKQAVGRRQKLEYCEQVVVWNAVHGCHSDDTPLREFGRFQERCRHNLNIAIECCTRATTEHRVDLS